MHRLLERQLRRFLGKDQQSDPALKPFLDIVDGYYLEVDKEQRLMQNALMTNAAELNAVNERLRVQNAEMTRTLLNTLSDGVYATDLQGQLTFMNAAAENMLGWQEGELIGRPMWETMQHHLPDGSPFTPENCPQLKVIRSGKEVDEAGHFITRSGSFIPVKYRSRPIILEGELIGALVSFQDISTLQQAEDKLREANAQLSNTVSELNFQKYALDQHSIVSIADRSGKITYANGKFIQISQYSEAELLGQDHRLLNSGYHPREFFAEMWQTIGRGEIWRGEVRNRRKDGSFYWVDSTIVPFMDEQGKPLRYVSIRSDITARKEMDERLVQQRSFYERISETLGEGLYVQDAQGLCIYVNSEAEHLLGWSRAEFIGKPVHDTIHRLTPDGRPLLGRECPIMLKVKAGKSARSDDQVFVRKDGSTFPVEVSSQGVYKDGQLDGVVVAFQDISDRKRNEHYIRDAQTRLNLALERLNLALDGSNLAMWDWDIANNKVYLSDRWSLMMGGQRNESLVTTEQLFEMVYPDDRQLVRGGLDDVLKGRALFYSVEFRVRRENGEWAWIHSHGKVVERGSDGRVTRMTGTNADVTERRAAEESLQKSETRLRTLYDSTSDAVMLLDEKGFFDCNLATLQMFGCATREEFCSCHPADLSPEKQPGGQDSMTLANQQIGVATEKGSHRFEWVHKRTDSGKSFDAEVLLNSMVLDGKPVLQATVRDITERKQAEELLRQAKESAEEASRAKSDFLANMSHEIRTPMNGIIGMTELALDTELNPEQKEYMGLVKSSADALLAIVNDILDFSKIEAGKMEIDEIEFDLPEVLSQTARSIALRAHQKGLELLLDIDADIPEVLIGDPGRLRQVVVNLIGNAIKFTEHGEIVVKAAMGSLQPNPDKVVLHISVRDTGIGIPREKFQAIFESFSQADTSTTRKYGGTGLGLSISTRLVELMGGCIWLESEVGKGSTFFIEVVLGRASAGAQPTHETVHLKDLRVLVVDDNATNRLLAVELMRRWGMSPTAVEDGHQAIAELARAKQAGKAYQLLLLDVRMPDMDGFAVIEHLRAQHEEGIAPIMMLTSEGQRGDAIRCRELGISAYLLKPYSQSDLFDAIMNTLGLANAEQAPLVTRHSVREAKRKLNVLLAEDNSVNQTLVTRLLQKFGHGVDVAGNGLVAVEKWQAGQYDLILMDVDMPELNGYGATARIRELEKKRGGHIPVIGLTAHVMQGSREECLAAGMDGYLSKPIDTEALWRELNNIATGGTSAGGDAAHARQELTVADFDKARGLMDNSRELFDEIVRLFLADAPPHMQHIRDGLARGDTEAVRHSAHTIKGMVGIFSAERALQAAEQVEMSAGQKGSEQAVAELEIAIGELQSAIRKYQW